MYDSSKTRQLFHFTIGYIFDISNKSAFDKLFSKYWINKLVHEHTKQFLFK